MSRDPLVEEHALELGLGLGFGDEIESQNNDNYDAVFSFGGDSGGLTVARFGSDSDSGGEEGEFEAQRNDEDEDDDDGNDDVHLCLARFLSLEDDVLEERLNDIDEVEVDGQSKSAANNSERNVELEFEDENDADLYSGLAVPDDDIYTTEFDVLIGQFLEYDSPPAAKSFVENLPLVELTEEELRGKDVACAICKNDIMLEEKVRRLPCSHCYHGDCIMPWLNMRNTCPVCRFKLPTVDADYEESKIHRAARGLLELAASHM